MFARTAIVLSRRQMLVRSYRRCRGGTSVEARSGGGRRAGSATIQLRFTDLDELSGSWRAVGVWESDLSVS